MNLILSFVGKLPEYNYKDKFRFKKYIDYNYYNR